MRIKNILTFFLLLITGFFTVNVHATPDTSAIHALLDKSKELQRTRQEESLRLAREASVLSQKIKYKKGLADANIRIGSILFTYGKLDSSRIIIDQALDLYTNLASAQGASAASLLLSYIYQDLGMKDSAFSTLYAALNWNREAKDSVRLAQIHINLGNLHLDYRNEKEAFENFIIAEEIAKINHHEENLISAWDGLGRYYLKTNKSERGLIYFLKIDSACNKNGDIYTVAQNLTNIALSHELQGDYASAKTYYQLALKSYTNLRMTVDLSLGHYNLGNILLLMNQPDSAIGHLNIAVSVARNTNDLVRVARSYLLLAQAYAIKGNYISAYQNQKYYSSLSDSLLNNEKVKQIAEMQTKYETEKKEQQIVLLDARNKARAAQRNIFVAITILMLLLAMAIFLGLLRTKKQKKISEELLLNILPAEIADELKKKGSAEARFYEEVTVMFTDFKNFTQIAEKMAPSELVELLHNCFKAFDHIITKYHVEKIKTIGDSYLCAGGLPVPNTTNPVDVVRAGLEIQEYMAEINVNRLNSGQPALEMRLGIHTGQVVAGIVGVKKFAYDIWGDTVNTASRMEHTGIPGKVNISEATFERIKDKFICTSRGKIEAKHKGMIEMYFVEGERVGNG